MKILLFPLIATILSSCSESSRQTEIRNDTTIISHSPADTQSNNLKRISSLIGLVEPSAKDSFVLRLWVNSMVTPHQMIELRKSEDGWLAKKNDFYDEVDGRVMFKNIPLKGRPVLSNLIDSLR